MMDTVPSGTILHGRYRIERVLGSGGFGHVYLAVDLQSNQQYAVKEYLVTGSSGQAQLQHEANVLSHLHHPNMPAFIEAFYELGHYFVVLSYIEGNDLTDIIRVARTRNEVISLPRIMHWLLSVSDAVQFLHNQHPPVIHRDIKPDNIRITSDGTAMLVDLGNAKATADGARTLFFIRHQGTPGYAPPEQYPGGTGTTVRSDVYALGGTLYFALTAHEPPSVSNRNQSIQQGIPDIPSLQDQLLNNPPEETPEAQAARQFRLGVSKPAKPAPRHIRHLAQLGTLPPPLLDRLNTIIFRAMAMHQRDRYHSAEEFSNDLRAVINALPSTPETAPRRPIDPNSTQPDLPMLYETLQAAKDAQPSPTTPPAAQTHECPRCGTPLVVNASFCPRCGTPLSGPSRPNPPSNSTSVASNEQGNGPSAQQTIAASAKASAQASANIGDVVQQAQQTLRPPANVQITTLARSEPSARLSAASTLPPVPQTPALAQSSQMNAPTTDTMLQTPPDIASKARGTQKQVMGLNRHMIIILLTALILLALILLFVLLLLKLAHGGHDALHLQYPLASQVSIYERYFNGGVAATSYSTGWIWTCGACVVALAHFS